jgi:hypothetical protein
MSLSKRVKFLDHPDTLDFDDLDIPSEIISPDVNIDEELREIALCFKSKAPLQKRKDLWNEKFPEDDSVADERDVVLKPITKQTRVNNATLPLPMDNTFLTWLTNSSRDAILAKPSLFAINFRTGVTYRSLCDGLEPFINKPLPNPAFTSFIESYGFNDNPSQYNCLAGVALEYTSLNAKLVLMTERSKILHFWIFYVPKK